MVPQASKFLRVAQDIGVSCEARNIWADGLGEREDYTPEERTSGGSMT